MKHKGIDMGMRVSTKYSNQREFAGSLSVSRKTLVLWLRRADWPIRKRAPWNEKDRTRVEEWRHWRQGGANYVNGGHAGQLNPERRAKLRLLVARRRRLDLQRRIQAGKFISRAEVEKGRVQRILAVKGSLLCLGERLTRKLNGLDDGVSIKSIVDAEVRQLLRTFAGQAPVPEEV